MEKRRRLFLTPLWVMVLTCLLVGCVHQVPPPPSSMAEYEQVQKTDPEAYSRHVILLHNLQRLLDGDLKPSDRVNSFHVVVTLGGDDPGIRVQMAKLLSEPKTPPEVHQAILAFLLKNDYPDLAGYVVGAMPNLVKYSALHDSVLDWLNRHPTPSVLSEVIKLWAAEPSATGPNESRYRLLVDRMTGKDFQQALLDEMNTPSFTASAAAFEVLAKRMSMQALTSRLLAMKAVTDDVAAVQTFYRRFEYLPADANEFAAVAQIYKYDRDMIEDAARLAGSWRYDLGYKFNIRDFHLISRMARDPLRSSLRRTQLTAALGQAFNSRQHLRYAAPQGMPLKDDHFWARADNLTVADLWNLYLLSDLLSRPRTQIAIRILADNDRADKTSAWGGLIFYKSGQAEATKYPSGHETAANDLAYVPLTGGKRGNGEFDFTADQRDSLCRFTCHFEKAENGLRAGPTLAELNDAKANNYYGVIFTSLNENLFCAHYYNPQGEVISLGVFPMTK